MLLHQLKADASCALAPAPHGRQAAVKRQKSQLCKRSLLRSQGRRGDCQTGEPGKAPKKQSSLQRTWNKTLQWPQKEAEDKQPPQTNGSETSRVSGWRSQTKSKVWAPRHSSREPCEPTSTGWRPLCHLEVVCQNCQEKEGWGKLHPWEPEIWITRSPLNHVWGRLLWQRTIQFKQVRTREN